VRAIGSCLYIAVVLGISAQALPAGEGKDAAPFGLEWGESVAQAHALGMDLQELPTNDFGNSYSATRLPKVIADVRTVALSFGYGDKLWRIAAVSKDFANDPYGAAIRARYNELSRVLAGKYGQGISHHHDVQNGKDENFLMYVVTGRAWHYTDYETKRIKIQVLIRATDVTTGYYMIIFKNKRLEAEFDRDKKAREKDAL